jgi:hypothetical protein
MKMLAQCSLLPVQGVECEKQLFSMQRYWRFFINGRAVRI